MTGAVPAPALPGAASTARALGHVLAGTELEGDAALLAARLDPAFLAGVGWDAVTLVLSMPAGHPLLGRKVCRAAGAPRPAVPRMAACAITASRS